MDGLEEALANGPRKVRLRDGAEAKANLTNLDRSIYVHTEDGYCVDLSIEGQRCGTIQSNYDIVEVLPEEYPATQHIIDAGGKWVPALLNNGEEVLASCAGRPDEPFPIVYRNMSCDFIGASIDGLSRVRQHSIKGPVPPKPREWDMSISPEGELRAGYLFKDKVRVREVPESE